MTALRSYEKLFRDGHPTMASTMGMMGVMGIGKKENINVSEGCAAGRCGLEVIDHRVTR